MSGRIRSIKPEILEDERSAALSSDSWRLWVSLWLLADDYGNLRGDPRRLAAEVFWALHQPPPVAELLHELTVAGFIEHYVVRGQQYIHLRNWEKHQRINWEKHQRIDNAGRRRVPGPSDADPVDSNSGGESPPAGCSRSDSPPVGDGVGDGVGDSPRTSATRGSDLDLDLEKDLDLDQEIAATASPPRPTDDLFPQKVNGGVEQSQPPAGKPQPLPFKPDQALQAIAEASNGRFVASKLDRGLSIHTQRLIRAHPDLAVWHLVGEWLGAGGEGWKDDLDARALAAKNFEAWLAHALKWRDDGKPPIDRRARASPTNADCRRGQAPVAQGLDYSAGGQR